jgi:hypothetical protein
LLHRQQGLHAYKIRDDRYSTSCLEATYASFVLGGFPEVGSSLFILNSSLLARE